VFEDPNGARVLYDPGHTVAGGTDPRLGKIDVILVSHMHADHVGEATFKAAGAGTCAKPDLSVPTPQTNVIDIALAKNRRSSPAARCRRSSRRGSRRAVAIRPARCCALRRQRDGGGVKIATVAALHSNGVDGDLIGGELGKSMKAAGIAGDVGPATGYVLRFSNGLVAYLSGDTGILADQQLVIRDYYHASLVVMNMATAHTGPAEAAYSSTNS